MSLAKKLLLAALVSMGGLVSSTAFGQIAVTTADLRPSVEGRSTVSQVAYRPYYVRRGYYGGYGGYYRPYRAYYGPRYGYGYSGWNGYYRPYYARPYYTNRVYGNPYGWSGYRSYYGPRYARPGYSYGWGW